MKSELEFFNIVDICAVRNVSIGAESSVVRKVNTTSTHMFIIAQFLPHHDVAW